MRTIKLGNFEEVVLLLIGALKDQAYSVAIVEAYAKETGNKINISAIHTVLYRLEDKGFLSSKLGEPGEGRGGKRKRLFSLTTQAIDSLKELAILRNQLINQIPGLTLGLEK